MNRTAQPRHTRSVLWVYTFTIFVLLGVLGQPDNALAQSQWTTNGNNINNTNTGNVGIGTSNPQSLLHLAGPSGGTAITVNTPGNQRFRFQSVAGIPNWGGLTLNANYNSGWQLDETSSNGWFLKLDTRGGNGAHQSNGLWLFRIPNGSNPHLDESAVFGVTNGYAYFGDYVGVGTTAPQFPLTVRNDSFNFSGLGNWRVVGQFDDAAGNRGVSLGYDSVNGNGILGTPSAAGFAIWGFDGAGYAEKVKVTGAGNVGIGTTAPVAKLDVNGSATFSGSTTVAGRGVFGIDNSNNLNLSMYNYFKINATGIVLNGTVETFDNYFGMRQTSNNTLTVYVPSSGNAYFNQGNVGIGTTNPQAKLDVQGNVSVTGNILATGNIAAKYQDVAEWVPSSQKLVAGTVVALDPEKSNHVLASSEAYDTRVAGVVSAQPGISLGERGEGKVLVATTGRVKVKVDATRAPIKIGDLLVTSDVAGVAMKSEPVSIGGRRMHAPGTIIGKALEPLEKGSGEILVLLSLQ